MMYVIVVLEITRQNRQNRIEKKTLYVIRIYIYNIQEDQKNFFSHAYIYGISERADF